MTASPSQGHLFRPRARIMLTLGLELISSETVALAELVKNAYDADANFVLIRLTGSTSQGQGVIDVLDDGSGMSPEVVSGVWLEPATPSRRRRPTSAGGRRSLGEKGLGRLAVAKLAERMSLHTKPAGGAETDLEVNWSDFEDVEKYLDEIDISWHSHDARTFAADGLAAQMWRRAIKLYGDETGPTPWSPRVDQGTLLRLSGLRSDWTEQLARDVERTLSRLVSPSAELAGQQTDFTVFLDLPAPLAAIGGLIGPPEELRRPHYRMDATVKADGEVELTTRLRLGDKPKTETLHLTGVRGRDPKCGPFTLHLLAWDRDRAALEEIAAPGSRYQDVRQALNRAAGVSVYRDGFRVLPYGEVGNDWLELDRRRIDDPSHRLSNNQVVGTVSITRDTNPDLFDQTNREGLVAGEPFADFRHMILELLVTLERRRTDERPPAPPKPKSSTSVVEPLRLDDLRAAANARSDSELTGLVDEAEAEIVSRTSQVREVLARYQRLATLGQLVDKMVHEVGQPAAAIRAAAVAGIEHIEDGKPDKLGQECRELLARVEQELEIVRTQARAAVEVLNRLAPFGGRRRGRPHTLRIEAAIADTVRLLTKEVRRTRAQISIPETTTEVTVDGTELQEIVLNLLTNSLYWLTRGPKGSERKIAIDVERNADRSLSLIVSDSGPGVPEADRERIFEPYFTTREGGYGLGLALAGEIVSEYYGGELELVTPGALGGATFRATLRRRVGE